MLAFKFALIPSIHPSASQCILQNTALHCTAQVHYFTEIQKYTAVTSSTLALASILESIPLHCHWSKALALPFEAQVCTYQGPATFWPFGALDLLHIQA